MSKIHDMGVHEGTRYICFHCPGCDGTHSIPVSGPKGWTWDQSLDKPTFHPSILYNVGRSNPTEHLCHSWVTEGKIEFLGDSTHSLAGQTVELPDWDDSRI